MPNLREIKEESRKEETLPTEEEVRRLRQELAAKEAQLKRLHETKKEKMAVIFPREKKEEEQKKIEKEEEEIKFIKEKPRGVSLPKPAAPAPKIKEKTLAADLAHIMSLPKPRQVKTLIYFAFKKGLHYATAIAEKMKNPYFLDEFHDTLVDELYELLKKKRKI
ncbi:MAG: hypothetical protein AB1465_04760 [Patescibacteria group bacterium]